MCRIGHRVHLVYREHLMLYELYSTSHCIFLFFCHNKVSGSLGSESAEP